MQNLLPKVPGDLKEEEPGRALWQYEVQMGDLAKLLTGPSVNSGQPPHISFLSF